MTTEPEPPPAAPKTAARVPFQWDPRMERLARAFGVTPDRAWVEVGPEHLRARFGPWLVDTPLANVADVQLTGPYQWWKVAGPPHISVADRGLTFGTNATAGVCIAFKVPVNGVDPFGLVRHPSLTVTTVAPAALMRDLLEAAGAGAGAAPGSAS